MSTLEMVATGTQSLIRTVDGLPDEAYAAPSLLPGWSRGHVVAHLALNAEGLAGVLNGLVTGEEVPMYASPESRDADIDELAEADPAALRARLLAATTDFADALERMTDEAWAHTVHRTPGGPTFPASQIPNKRLSEVEIHHADLDAGYDRTMWPVEFATSLLSNLSPRLDGHGPLTLRATDLGRTWSVGGEGGPWIAGPVADLAWWVTGRDGAGLTSETGTLPAADSW
ncbi:maleylpyruvate isomerase family mycothiol-dependent enzyme [Nocardioides sp. LHG3406-4]|uniref:maleylpyruvate isomerase family mycothiol-dependent enzyme n=1 Tax=Nocardioides sp. LHG3406-4 TaxID=2804575 RepID=UPI003CFA9DA5